MTLYDTMPSRGPGCASQSSTSLLEIRKADASFVFEEQRNGVALFAYAESALGGEDLTPWTRRHLRMGCTVCTACLGVNLFFRMPLDPIVAMLLSKASQVDGPHFATIPVRRIFVMHVTQEQDLTTSVVPDWRSMVQPDIVGTTDGYIRADWRIDRVVDKARLVVGMVALFTCTSVPH